MRYKLITLVLTVAVVMGLVVAGCAKPAPPAPTPAPAPAPAPPAPEKTWTLKFAFHSTAVHDLTVKGHDVWAKDVEEATGGRVKVLTYPGQTLCKGKDTWDAVKGGIADVGWAFEGLFPGKFPVTGVVFLPCLCQHGNAQTYTHVLMDLYNEFPEMQAEYADVKVLHFNCLPQQFVATSKKPVRKLEDLNGLKLRCTGTELTEFMKAQGVAPIPLGPADIYENLQKGVIDGYIYSWDGALARKLYELTKYCTNAKCYSGPFFTVMNLDVWNSLPPDIQRAIDGVSGIETGLRIAKAMDDTEISWWEVCEENGIERIELSAAEQEKWREAAKPTWDKWVAEREAEGVPGQEIIDEALRLFEKYCEG